MKIIGLFGRLILGIAGFSLMTGMMLFMVGAYLVTMPLMRLSPKERRMRAAMDMAAAVFGMIRSYAPVESGDEELDESHDLPDDPPQPYPFRDGDVWVVGPNAIMSDDSDVLNYMGMHYVRQRDAETSA